MSEKTIIREEPKRIQNMEFSSTDKNKFIEVCDNCLQASCWQGVLLCEQAKSAGTTLKTIRELQELDLEHPNYWSEKTMIEVFGHPAPNGYEGEKKESDNEVTS